MSFGKKSVVYTDFNAQKLTQLTTLRQDSETALSTFNIAVASLEAANKKIDEEIADIKTYIANATSILNELTAQRSSNERVMTNIKNIFGVCQDTIEEVA